MITGRFQFEMITLQHNITIFMFSVDNCELLIKKYAVPARKRKSDALVIWDMGCDGGDWGIHYPRVGHLRPVSCVPIAGTSA